MRSKTFIAVVAVLALAVTAVFVLLAVTVMATFLLLAVTLDVALGVSKFPSAELKLSQGVSNRLTL